MTDPKTTSGPGLEACDIPSASAVHCYRPRA